MLSNASSRAGCGGGGGGRTCRGCELGVPQRRGGGPLQRRQQLAVDDDVCVAPDGRSEVGVEVQGQSKVALAATAGPCVPCQRRSAA